MSGSSRSRTCSPFVRRSTRCSSDKGLLTGDQLDLIRHGTKSQAVVTGMRTTGAAREDYREVELAVMVSRP